MYVKLVFTINTVFFLFNWIIKYYLRARHTSRLLRSKSELTHEKCTICFLYSFPSFIFSLLKIKKKTKIDIDTANRKL